jgi:hypothetical protein
MMNIFALATTPLHLNAFALTTKGTLTTRSVLTAQPFSFRRPGLTPPRHLTTSRHISSNLKSNRSRPYAMLSDPMRSSYAGPTPACRSYPNPNPNPNSPKSPHALSRALSCASADSMNTTTTATTKKYYYLRGRHNTNMPSYSTPTAGRANNSDFHFCVPILGKRPTPFLGISHPETV